VTYSIARYIGHMLVPFFVLFATASISQAASFVLPEKCKSGATGDGSHNLSDDFPPIVIAYGLAGDKSEPLPVYKVFPMTDNSKVWVANIEYTNVSFNGGFNVEVAYTPVFVTFEYVAPSAYGVQAITLPRPDQPSSRVAEHITLTVFADDQDDDSGVIPGAFVELRPLAKNTSVSLPSSLTMEANDNGQLTLNCASFRDGDIYATVYTSSNEYAYDSEVYTDKDGNLYVEPGGSE